MMAFLARRILQLIPVLWGVGTLVFFLLHLVPGDPIDIMLGENAMPANKEALRKSLNLDLPLSKQYVLFWKSAVQGNLGESFLAKKPVKDMIWERLSATFSLALVTLAWAILVSIPLGVISAAWKNSIFDRLVLLFTILGVSFPTFWIGPLFMLLFSVHLGWFPVSEKTGASSYFLPSLTLGLGLAAILTRMTRTTMAEVLSHEYITTARSKGLSSTSIYMKHALKNALIPIITLIGLQLGSLLAGAVITETIFDWPGLGELVYRGIQSRDFPVVQGCVLVIAFTYVFANTLADLAYSIANPRIALK